MYTSTSTPVTHTYHLNSCLAVTFILNLLMSQCVIKSCSVFLLSSFCDPLHSSSCPHSYHFLRTLSMPYSSLTPDLLPSIYHQKCQQYWDKVQLWLVLTLRNVQAFPIAKPQPELVSSSFPNKLCNTTVQMVHVVHCIYHMY